MQTLSLHLLQRVMSPPATASWRRGPPAWRYGKGRGDLVGYRSAFRPLRSGLAGEAPRRGFLKNSESGTSRVAASRSNTSNVGFSACRSRPPENEVGQMMQRDDHLSGREHHVLRAASVADNFCIWPQALPLSRPSRLSRARRFPAKLWHSQSSSPKLHHGGACASECSGTIRPL
jgi:hypothetical protein